MIRSFTLIFFIAVSFISHAQLYTPRDITRAYEKETRSPDGRPGKNYWQNHGRYDIHITATPPSRTVYGIESISYINNSPDTLKHLIFRLIQNIHKPGAVRLSPAPEDYLTSGIHIDSLVINGTTLLWKESPYYNTVHPVALRQPLNPHDSVQLFVKWHFDASLKSGREGMIDSTTYFLAYAYPRISVYDDYNGWDMTEFNDALEFYNDFNDYVLHVQVPANYLVWATGDLQNAGAVLQPAFANKYNQSLTSDQTIHIATKADLTAKNVTAQNNMNTWLFTANNVPDVALGLSDHFVWDATSVVVDPTTQRRASVQAAFNDTAVDYHQMTEFAKHALDWLSRYWPGVPYPYSKTTVFQGYAGMEYPMMANDEAYSDPVFSRFVAEHEIAHTYMPFYMGINETRYGFMDEGWATTFEYLIAQTDLGEQKAKDFYKNFRVNSWINDPSADEDLPIITPGPNLNGGGLGNNEYGKPSLGYLAMKDLLGDALFKKCLHEYMNRWHGKHPIPWDFFYTFNNASGQDLNLFWNNWFFSHNYIDLALKNVKPITSGYSISVQNIGGMVAPFDLRITYTDGTTETKHQTPKVWEQNQKMTTITLATKKKIQSVSIDGGIFMDADESNNTWTGK